MKKNLEHLTIVCNGSLTAESRDKLEKFSDDIIVRENVGYDMEAWRLGILRHQNNFSEYDELVLLNDSFYGPFYPFKKMFDDMDEKKSDADFWGITLHGKMDDALNICPYGYIPEHIQSYFMVFRKKMFHSAEFLGYWENLELSKNFQEAIRTHEVCMTKEFFDKGFKYDVYCDTREWEKDYIIKIDHCLISPDKLLKDFKCPILKKKFFLLKRDHSLHYGYADLSQKVLNFIKNDTNYDIDLIIKNLLRKQNITKIKSTLNLNYPLPTKNLIADVEKNILSDAVIIAHLFYEDLMPRCVEYLCNAPKNIKLVVTVSTDERKKIVEELFKNAGRECEIRLVSARGRDLSALLVGCADLWKKYKYLCFIHDKKSMRLGEPITMGRFFFNMIWENTLASENYIKNILATFEQDPRLGILACHPPYHGEYKNLFFIANFWSGDCFTKTLELAESLGISKNLIDEKIAPLALGSVFWCRTESLKKIINIDWKAEDFPEEPMPKDGTISHALERIFPFVAQTEGFYTGWLFTEEFSKVEVENFIFLAKSYNEILLGTADPNSLIGGTYVPTLTALVKYKVPEKYWKYLKPVKKLLNKIRGK